MMMGPGSGMGGAPAADYQEWPRHGGPGPICEDGGGPGDHGWGPTEDDGPAGDDPRSEADPAAAARHDASGGHDAGPGHGGPAGHDDAAAGHGHAGRHDASGRGAPAPHAAAAAAAERSHVEGTSQLSCGYLNLNENYSMNYIIGLYLYAMFHPTCSR